MEAAHPGLVPMLAAGCLVLKHMDLFSVLLINFLTPAHSQTLFVVGPQVYLGFHLFSDSLVRVWLLWSPQSGVKLRTEQMLIAFPRM